MPLLAKGRAEVVSGGLTDRLVCSPETAGPRIVVHRKGQLRQTQVQQLAPPRFVFGLP